MAIADLRALMAERGLTQKQTAELLGVSVKTIEAWCASETAANYSRMPQAALAKLVAIEGLRKLSGTDAAELHSKADRIVVEYLLATTPTVGKAYVEAEERIGFLYG